MNKELLQKAKPIIFNTKIVKAILDARKTQTRRVINKEYLGMADIDDNNIYVPNEDGECINILKTSWSKYKVGDVLYVREAFVLEGMTYDENGEIIHHEEPIIHYKADEKKLNWVDEWENECNIPWKPSIHMPKKYARIFLKVTNVRVERLQDITRKDVLSEGIREHAVNQFQPHTCIFKAFWNSTSKDGYRWEYNPFVFVYEFKKVKVC